MASDHGPPKDGKFNGLSKTISWMRKFYSNFTAGAQKSQKENEEKIKPRRRGKKKKPKLDLALNEPDIMMQDKDKIRTSVRIYQDHPPDFPTSEQIKARLIAAEKYYGVPRTARPVGEGMVFEEDAKDVVQIRPSWAYILERPLVEQYVLMSNYIRRLSAMSELALQDNYKFVEEEARVSEDDLGDVPSCVTGRSSLSYLGSMYVRPATSPSVKEEDVEEEEEKEEDEDVKAEIAGISSIPAVEMAEAGVSEYPEPRKSFDDFYPILDDDTPQSSYEKHEIEISYPPRTSLVISEKDLSHESSLQKLSGSRDSFLEFRNMRVETPPERQYKVVMERKTEVKANRMIVDESLTLNKREVGNNEKTVKFLCPPGTGGGVSRIAKIFERGSIDAGKQDSAGPSGLKQVQFKYHQPQIQYQIPQPIQTHEGNLLTRKNFEDGNPEIERIPLPSFSGSESGNDSPDEGGSV